MGILSNLFKPKQDFLDAAPTDSSETPGLSDAPVSDSPAGNEGGLDRELILRLGDVLSRIPAGALKPGPIDGQKEIRFPVKDLFSDISRGRASVQLSRLANLCPGIFREDLGEESEQQIPLPLQKLVEQIGTFPPRGVTEDDIMARGTKGRKAPASRITKTEETQAARPLPPKAPLPPRQPAESPAPAKAAEEPPPALSSASDQAVLPLPPVISPTETATFPPANSQLSTVSGSSTTLELPLHPPVESRPLPRRRSYASLMAALKTNDEERIELSLAAILRSLPPGFAKTEPPVAENTRISIPFHIVEPQLATGNVEISARQFLDSLPGNVKVRLCDESKPVPVPLHEVFQRLPGSAHLLPDPAPAEPSHIVEPPAEIFKEVPVAAEIKVPPTATEGAVSEHTAPPEVSAEANPEARSEPETQVAPEAEAASGEPPEGPPAAIPEARSEALDDASSAAIGQETPIPVADVLVESAGAEEAVKSASVTRIGKAICRGGAADCRKFTRSRVSRALCPKGTGERCRGVCAELGDGSKRTARRFGCAFKGKPPRGAANQRAGWVTAVREVACCRVVLS